MSRLAAEALDGALGRRVSVARVDLLARRAREYAAPAVVAQILALLALASPGSRASLLRRFRTLDLPSTRRERERTREFLSLAEAESLLRGADVTCITRFAGAPRP